jgi:hypothetical protein
MNKQNAKAYLPLVQALIEGKTIQYCVDDGETWVDLAEPSFTYYPDAYRIKPEPHPAESWPVDAKILVRDYEGGEWVKRYFAKFENGLLHAWTGGGTSWSFSDSATVWKFSGPTTVWKFAKLAEEE